MQRYGKPSPYRYGALSGRGSLAESPEPARYAQLLHTVTEDAKALLDPEAVRARARLLAIAAMDDLDSRRSSMDVSQLVDTVNAAGKLTGAQSATVAHSHQHRLMSGEDRAQRAAELIQRATARLLNEGANDTDTRTVSDTEDANVLPDTDIG